MLINIPAFLSSLEIMVIGMVGIFIVTVAIILVIRLLNSVTTEKKDK